MSQTLRKAFLTHSNIISFIEAFVNMYQVSKTEKEAFVNIDDVSRTYNYRSDMFDVTLFLLLLIFPFLIGFHCVLHVTRTHLNWAS
jgi:hypothetical protein